jgi:hypothetical protein
LPTKLSEKGQPLCAAASQNNSQIDRDSMKTHEIRAVVALTLSPPQSSQPDSFRLSNSKYSSISGTFFLEKIAVGRATFSRAARLH